MSCKRQVQHVYSCLVRASKMTTHKRPPLYVAYTSLVLGQAVLPIPLARAVRCLNEPSARTCSPSNETIASSFRGSQRPFRCLPISNDAFKLCTSHPNDRTRLAPKPIARASDESACGGRKPGARCFTVHIMYGGGESRSFAVNPSVALLRDADQVYPPRVQMRSMPSSWRSARPLVKQGMPVKIAQRRYSLRYVTDRWLVRHHRLYTAPRLGVQLRRQ